MADIENESLIDLARQAYQDGRYEDAERACRGVLGMGAEDPEALTLLGGIQLRSGQNQDALRLLGRAAELRTEDITTLQWLGEALFRLDRPRDAAAVFQKALELSPDNMALLKLAGRAYMHYGDLNRAGACFHRCLQQEGEHPPALFGLGLCFYRDGHYRKAIDALSRYVQYQPDNLSGRLHLANALLYSRRYQEAQQHFEAIKALPGGEQRALQGLAGMALERAQPDQAEQYLREFEAAGGDPRVAATIRARIAKLQGDDAGTRQNLRLVINDDPDNLDAWVQLVEMGPEYLKPDEVKRLGRLAERLAGRRRARGLFALARVQAYQQEREGELRLLHQANQIMSRGHEREVEQELGLFRAMEAVCDASWLEALSACEAESALRPIFVCGMPRSGTTLTEQILSSHSEVTPLAESFAAEAAVRHAARQLGVTQLQQVLTQAPERLPELIREGYRAFLTEHEGVEQGIFTDKSMWLLPYLPLLWKAFPNATFIHVRRHPLDVTFGCYRQLFSGGQAFSYTVEGCAAYYAHSERLMQRYKEFLPGRIHELRYESLIADPEGSIRSLLEWAGLAWDDRVLEFYKNDRVVNTASTQQVRQGLFTDAAGRWRDYGELLAPFRRALEAEGVDPAIYDDKPGGG